MTKRLLCLVVLLMIAAYAPAMAEGIGGPSLTGTKWSGVDSDGDLYTVWFRADNHLAYTSPTGGHMENAATWSVTNGVVTWDFNNGYARYTARVDGDVMRGTAVNVKDHKWTFEWKRVTEVPKLDGSTWKGKDARWTMRFEPGGVFVFKGEKEAQGTWEQTGDEVEIVLGRLRLHGWVSGKSVGGTMTGGEGETSPWSAERAGP